MLVSEAISHIKHTLASTLPADLPGATADARAIYLVNYAGRILCGMHPWRWLDRRTTTLDYVASQNYVLLPADFGSIHYVIHTDTPHQPVYPSSLEEVLIARLNSIASTDTLRYAISWIVSASVQYPILEIDRTPSAADSAALTVVYRGTWVEIDQTTDTLPLPVLPNGTGGFCDLLYLQILRALARGWEEEGKASFDARFARIKSGPVFMAAAQQDGQAQATLGQMRGGAVSQARNHAARTTITDFSSYTGPS